MAQDRPRAGSGTGQPVTEGYPYELRLPEAPYRFEWQGEAAVDARKHATDACKGVQDAIKSALDRLGSPPAEPLRPLLSCSEPTIEGLMKILAKGWPSVGVFSDEGGMFIGREDDG